MRFVVYGAGAVGGVVGARLFQHGHDVTLIARGEHLRAIRERGLRLETPSGDVTLPVPVVGGPDELDLGVDDVVLLAVKSQDTPEALAALLGVAAAETPIVCLQNGVENERAASRHFPRVYGIPVRCFAGHLEPGVVVSYATGITAILDVGRYPVGIDEQARALAAAFARAQLESRADEHIMRWKWRKLVSNLNNAVGALFGPDGHDTITELALREGEMVLDRAGIDYVSREENVARVGTSMTVAAARGAAWPGSSTWQSLVRRTGAIEVDYLNGEIVLLGRIHGLATPVNALLQREANRVARSKEPPGSMRPDEFLAALDAGASAVADTGTEERRSAGAGQP